MAYNLTYKGPQHGMLNYQDYSGNNQEGAWGEEDQDDTSSLVAAAEAAAKVDAMLIAKGMLKPNQKHTGTNIVTKKTSAPNNLVVAEVEINNLSPQCRNTLTRGTTQEEISRASGAAVTTRGRYMAPNEKAKNLKDRCLYLNVQASKKESVDIAVQKIHEIIREKCGNRNDFFRGPPGMRGGRMRPPFRPNMGQRFPMRGPQGHRPPRPLMSLPTPPPPNMPPPQPQTMTIMQEKLYIGLEHAPPNFDTKNKILGPGGSYLQHIQNETGAIVSLRGKGSGFGDINGPDAYEPMHVHIEHPSLACLGEAKKLAENLIQTVQQSYVRFQQDLAAMPLSVPTDLISGVPQQPPPTYMEQQMPPPPDMTQMTGIPEQAMQSMQHQEYSVQPMGPPTILMPPGSVANQIPQMPQALANSGPQMVIPQSISLSVPLVSNMSVSAPPVITQQPGQLEVAGQPPLMLTQAGGPPQALAQMVPTLGPPQPQAPPPQQMTAQPMAYTHVQPTMHVVSQAPVSMAPGTILQQPNVSMAPPPILQSATVSMAPPSLVQQPGVSLAGPGLLQQQPNVSMAPPAILHTQPSVSMAPPGMMQQPNVSMAAHTLLQQPNVSMAPPGMLQTTVSMPHTVIHQPNVSGANVIFQQQGPPPPHVPHSWNQPGQPIQQAQLMTSMSAPTSVMYTVASSTVGVSHLSGSPAGEIKRRFTEEKDDKIPENVLGYQHGPPHLVNLLRSSPPLSHTGHHLAVSHQGPHQRFQPPPPGMFVTTEQGQQYFQSAPQQVPPRIDSPGGPPHFTIAGSVHRGQMGASSPGPDQQQQLQNGQGADRRSPIQGQPPTSSATLMPPPPPPSPLTAQSADSKADARAMPPPKSPEPWEQNQKRRSSSQGPDEPEKKKIRGILKNKSATDKQSEDENPDTKEETDEQTVSHPAAPQYQGQPLRYPTRPSDPNLPPTSQESGILHLPGGHPLPSDPNLPPTSQEMHQPGLPPMSMAGVPPSSLAAVHIPPSQYPPGHHPQLIQQIDPNLPPGSIHITHQPLQMEGARPVGPPPSQILMEHAGGPPIQLAHRLQVPPPASIHLEAPGSAPRPILMEHQAPPQGAPPPLPNSHPQPPPHLGPPQPPSQQEMLEYEAGAQQLPPAPLQFQNFEHMPTAQPGEQVMGQPVIVSSTQPFLPYSAPMSSAPPPPPPPPPASYAMPTSSPAFPMPSQPHLLSCPPPGPGQYTMTLAPSSAPQFQTHVAGLQPGQALPPGHMIQATHQPAQPPNPVASQPQYQPHSQALPYWVSQA